MQVRISTDADDGGERHLLRAEVDVAWLGVRGDALLSAVYLSFPLEKTGQVAQRWE